MPQFSYTGSNSGKPAVQGRVKRSYSLDENFKDDETTRHNQKNSGSMKAATTSPHTSRHHSSAPLVPRYEYGSTSNNSPRLVDATAFSVFNPDQIIEKSAAREFHDSGRNSRGSDVEQQSLLGENDSANRQMMMQQKKFSGKGGKKKEKSGEFMYNLIYALLNILMSIPSLYGYASVIFNNDVYQPHIATLSKLVIWSSTVHQLTFVAFSSLSFAKAEVQDAGLLFLSCMSNFIAETIVSEGGGIQDILSTTIVTLGVATASLGVVLVLLGKFNCANAVSYLPLPVVGGYLAFIGYFCVIAGVGLCTSKSMINGGFLSDVELLMNRETIMLAAPGLLAGLLMMMISRFGTSEAALPITMVAIPALFYIILFIGSYSLDDARQGGWVGEVQPSASIGSLVDLVDFSLVRWDLVFSTRCFSVWLGMVFVVSFSSCLDVAAISMDMGEALDVNKELITVGISNVFSGLSFGQTGSYIFSQSIFQYRTGYLSRRVGIMGALMFLSVVLSSVNLLEIVPLFFLGSTLIFIGIDLLYEWLLEVYHKLIPSEYIVLMITFIAIQWVGINGGIVVGIFVAGGEYIVSTARESSVRQVLKRSRNIWQPQHRKLLQDVGYDNRNPRIVTLEVRDTVFFGSSLSLLSKICNEIGIDATATDMVEISFASPRHSGRTCSTPTAASLTALRRNREMSQAPLENQIERKKIRPKYVILEVSQVPNVDATAARSCFLQLAKMCSKNGIMLCAVAANPKVDWTLRSHDVAYSIEEEAIIKNQLLYPHKEKGSIETPFGKVLLFDSLNVALHLCENKLIYDLNQTMRSSSLSMSKNAIPHSALDYAPLTQTKLATIFSRILGIGHESEIKKLSVFETGGSAQVEEVDLTLGDTIYKKDEDADSFYIVLFGSIEIHRSDDYGINSKKALTSNRKSMDNLSWGSAGEVVSYLQVGGIFGYIDFSLGRRRTFNAICSSDKSIVARITRSMISKLEKEDPDVHRILEKVLLQATLMELANFDVA